MKKRLCEFRKKASKSEAAVGCQVLDKTKVSKEEREQSSAVLVNAKTAEL